MFYLLFCQFSWEPSFPIFKYTIYIRVPLRTDPFDVHTAFAVLEPV